MPRQRHIPAYSLFGQPAGVVEPRFCHVERIGDRWKQHGGMVEGHVHPHLHQMTLWLAGSGSYVADDSISDVRPGTLCWIPAGVVHGFRIEAGSEAIVLSMSEDFAREQLAGMRMGGLGESAIICPGGAEAGWLRSLFTRMENEYARPQLRQVECIGALASLVLAECLRGQDGDEAAAVTHGIEPSLLVRFMGLVEVRLGQRPAVDELAAELGSTPYLLNRVCREALGVRASDVVRARHMQEAKRLLQFTSLNVSEVAVVAGYPDPAHFTRSFRAHTGQTPRQWREARTSDGRGSVAH